MSGKVFTHSGMLNFRKTLEAAGLLPGRIIADGKRHRVPLVGGLNGRKTGWYVLQPRAWPHAFYCDRRGETRTWYSPPGGIFDPNEESGTGKP